MKFINITLISIIIAGSVMCGAQRLHAKSISPTEYEVKAAFIYNFIKFIEWPDNYYPDGDMPICVLGGCPFGKSLENISGKIIKNKIVASKNIKSPQEAKGCYIVFISGSERGHLAEILETFAGSNILTISDTKGFAEQGVVINLFIENNKVRFEVNIDAAGRAGLEISSKLLSLARVVHDQSKE